MRSYRLRDKDTLVFAVDEGVAREVTFDATRFHDIEEATAEELSTVLNDSGDLAAYVDDDGSLVLATPSRGSSSSLLVDVGRSSAAAALGLTDRGGPAYGFGLRPPRLLSVNVEPFAIEPGARMTVVQDGRRRTVTFTDVPKGGANAADVVAAVNAKIKGLARVHGEGRVILTSSAIGPDASLAVERAKEGEADAAEPIGFTGPGAADHPHPTGPAQLTCTPAPTSFSLVNLTSQPIELHFTSGTTLLPARGSVAVDQRETAYGPLQSLIQQGRVGLSAGKQR